MAAAADKAKAAHKMKDEEIAADIDEINAYLNEPDEAILEEIDEFDAAFDAQIATIYSVIKVRRSKHNIHFRSEPERIEVKK